jgi:hypothetical protein
LVLLREVGFQVWWTDSIPARDADPDAVGRIIEKKIHSSAREIN